MDAEYVDIIHTDANDLVGTTEIVGHIDFLPNGGTSQPGCSTEPGKLRCRFKLRCITNDLGASRKSWSYFSFFFVFLVLHLYIFCVFIISHDVLGILGPLTCDHFRAPEYYIASIQNRCFWKAYPCSKYLYFLFGWCNHCDGECPSLGYDADQTRKTGTHFLYTNSEVPFCGRVWIFLSAITNREIR